MKLIEEPSRLYLLQIKPNESEYSYLQKSTDEFSKATRERLNSYFDNISQENQQGLKTRFKADFKSAYFELLIHQIFHHMGFEIDEHPLVLGTDKKPDYLVKKNGEEIYIECKEFKNLSDDEKEIEKTRKDILYKLSTLRSKYFLYNIKELIVHTPQIPDISAFIQDVQGIMNESPNISSDEDKYVHALPEFNSSELIIRLELTLKYDWEEENEENELLGTHMGSPIFDFPEKSLRRGLKDKMIRYGITDRPLIVTLNVNSIWYCKKYIFEQILYGDLEYNFSTEKTTRKDNGLFSESNHRIDHVAGALIFFMAQPYGVDGTKYYFFKNPNFNGNLSSINFLTSVNFNKGQIEVFERENLKTLVGE